MKYSITTFLLACLFLYRIDLSAQCSCTDCPVFTISNSTVTSTLNISGATNPTLGVNGQGLAEVCFDYSTDAIDEVDISLTSPDGTVIFLALQTGISVNSGLQFNFCFVPCNCPAMPDPGFSAVFDSAEDWVAGAPYIGTYYPADGTCFESYTGPVNGDWILTIQDFIGFDDGIVQDWSISFLDNAGVGCTTQTSCVPFLCEAYGGEINQPTINLCEGDPALDFNITVSYPNGPQPNPVDYEYTYVLSETSTGVIIDYLSTPDLSSSEPGEYTICGLSYFIDHLPLIPTPNGIYTVTDLTDDITSELFCADLAVGCWDVTIVEIFTPDISGPLEICAGEISTFTIGNYDASQIYEIFITSGITSSINLMGSTLEIVWESGPGSFCIDASGTCGTYTDCFDIEVSDGGEDILVVGNLTVCEDEIVTYGLLPAIEGNEMWQFVIENGAVINQTATSVTIAWNGFDFETGSLCVDIVGTSCEFEEVCIDVDFYKYDPPLTLNSPTSICLNEPSISFIEEDPTYLDYTWELTNLVEIAGNGTPVIEFIGAIPGLATVCLEITTACGIQEPICEDIFVEPIPILDIEVDQDICTESFDLIAIFPSGGIVTWSQISGPAISVILFPTSNQTTVITSVSGEYLYNANFVVNGCSYDQEITVNIFDDLVASVIEQTCINDQEYNATIEIIGGNGPYQVDLEELVGSIYTTDNIPSGEEYSFLITDSNGCFTNVSGTYSCSCDTEAGEMSEELLEACAQNGSAVTANYLGGETNDGNDISAFVLHDNNGTVLGNILAINDSGIFVYDPTYLPGETYYISYIIGNEINDEVDLMDGCLSSSIGQPVIFYGIPASDIPTDQEICMSEWNYTFTNVSNTFALTWELLAGPGNVDFVIDGLETGLSFEEFGTYTLEYSLINEFCGFTGQFDVSVGSAPTIENLGTECSDDLLTFDLIVELSGGLAPYVVEDLNEITNSTYTGSGFDVNQAYTFILLDALGCETQLEVGPINCDCAIELGTIQSDSIQLCEGELFDPTIISNQDYNIEEGQDTFGYLFYATENTPIDSPLFISYGETVDPNGIFTSNTWYYVRFAVGAFDTSTQIIDFDDPCFTYSDPVALIWNPVYEFDFDVHPTVCSADPFYTFEQFFPGPFPYVVTFSTAEGFELELEITEVETMVTLPIFEGITEWSIVDVSTNCGFTYQGNFTITALDPFDVEITAVDSICNNSLFGSTVDVSTLFESQEFPGTWFLDGMELIGDEIDFDGFIEGTHLISFSTEGFEGPCPGATYAFSIYVKACECPIVNSPSDIEICSTEEQVELDGLWITNFSGYWQITNPNNLNSPPVIIGSDIQVEGATPGIYEIVFGLDDNFPAQCDTEFPIFLTIEEQLSTGQQAIFPVFCSDDDQMINLVELLEDSDEGGEWIVNGTTIGNEINTVDLQIGDNIYEYTIAATEWCDASSSEVTIVQVPIPDADITTIDVLCYGDTNGEVDILILDNGFTPYSWTLNGVPSSESPIENLEPGTYVVEISNSEGCTVLIEDIVIDEPEIVSVTLGEDKTVGFNEVITIEALVNLISSDIGTINWSDLSGQIEGTDLVLIQQAISNNTITIKVTDTNGCVAFDEIQIRLDEEEIKLSNIFVPNSQIEKNRSFGVPAFPQMKAVNEFRIYDRWGNLVHEALDFDPGEQGSFWSGRWNGKEVVAGVYAYYVRYTDILDNERFIVGDVTVIY